MSSDNVKFSFVIDYKQKYYDYETSYTSYTENQINPEERVNGLISGPGSPESNKLSGFKTSQFEGDSSGITRNIKIKQGIEIRTVDEATHRTLPFVSIGDDIDSGYSFLYKQEMNHALLTNNRGYTESLIKDEDGLVVFSDIASYNPVSYISEAGSVSDKETLMYVYTETNTFKLPTDNNSSNIDVLGTRELLFDIDKNKNSSAPNYIGRRYYRGINASFSGGEDRDIGLSLGEKPLKQKRGTCSIDDFIRIQELTKDNNSSDLFLESSDRAFDEFSNSKNIYPKGTLPEDEYQEKNLSSMYKFDELKDYFNYKATVALVSSDLASVINGIKSSVMYNSEIGSKVISMTSGFVYENTTLGNTTLGTDSIAFGGLNRS